MSTTLSRKRTATPSPERDEQSPQQQRRQNKREKKTTPTPTTVVGGGSPPSVEDNTNYESKTIRFTIQNFRQHTETRGEPIVSPPVFRVHGYEWSIVVYPRGDDNESNVVGESDDDDIDEECGCECVSLYLGIRRLNRAARVPATFTIRCIKDKDKQHKRDAQQHTSRQQPIRCTFDEENSLFGSRVSRQRVLEHLLEADGSLTIECYISISEEHRGVWYPEDLPSDSVLLDLYRDAPNTGDVVFSVVGNSNSNSNGHATNNNATTRKFVAHKGVLSLRCKRLYEITTSAAHTTTATTTSNTTTKPPTIRIPSSTTSPQVFKKLLEFVYTVKTPSIRTKEDAVEVLEAAARYGCRPLQDHMEAVLLNRFLNAEHAASLLVLAESHKCALLKERVTNFFVRNAAAVTRSKDWYRVEQSNKLLKDLLGASIEKSKDNTKLLKELLGVATSYRSKAPMLLFEDSHQNAADPRGETNRQRGGVVLVSQWKKVYRIE